MIEAIQERLSEREEALTATLSLEQLQALEAEGEELRRALLAEIENLRGLERHWERQLQFARTSEATFDAPSSTIDLRG